MQPIYVGKCSKKLLYKVFIIKFYKMSGIGLITLNPYEIQKYLDSSNLEVNGSDTDQVYG